MSTTKWNLDPSHSEVQFKVKHLAITTVTGSFNSFEAVAETSGDDFSSAHISFSADASSINTGNEQRDGHLKSPEFFDVEKSPKITFVSTKFEKTGKDSFKLIGDLTIKGTSKSVTLDVEFGGIQKDPYGNIKAGFTLSGKINRKDFGLSWNAAIEGGGVVVSEEVRILAEIQLAKQA
jgi:polyisoprenoid-binding protein YceI